MISTRTHAISDYLLPLGIATLAACRQFGPQIRRLAVIGPLYHVAYTVFTRHEGGIVPVIPMRTHLALDSIGALTFVGAGTLLRDRPAWQRLLVAGIGLSELIVVALSDDRPPSTAGRRLRSH